MTVCVEQSDDRVLDMRCTNNTLIVDLMDGRTISVPLSWFPRLLNAAAAQRSNWETCGGVYGIHWPDLDEDLSVGGLLRGVLAK